MNFLLQLTPHDCLVARDGRPFGLNQGQRMRGLPWLLPSVVAGSFRTALVKSKPGLDFSWKHFSQDALLQVNVHGVFPVSDEQLYFPAPLDVVAEPLTPENSRTEENNTRPGKLKAIHRAAPQNLTEVGDFPHHALRPVMLTEDQAPEDFKPAEIPYWWPLKAYIPWLMGNSISFNETFLSNAVQETRDHVCLDPERGAAADSQLFATTGLNLTYLRKYGVNPRDAMAPFHKRWSQVNLCARVDIPEAEEKLLPKEKFNMWHPLGGERRLNHWRQHENEVQGWTCPKEIHQNLSRTQRVRMILVTPAIFSGGWKPGWLDKNLEGNIQGVRLKLVGVTNGRWKAVSGWSLAKPRGPKAIRRMVPAGSVYFFEVRESTNAAPIAANWLQPVSDGQQEKRDGFGLAVWGTW